MDDNEAHQALQELRQFITFQLERQGEIMEAHSHRMHALVFELGNLRLQVAEALRQADALLQGKSHV